MPPTRTRATKQSAGLFLMLRICPVRVSFQQTKKQKTPSCDGIFCFYGGVGETRTLAPVARPTPLAGVPRHQLEYYSMVSLNKRIFCFMRWRRGRDSNPWLLRVTGFQDQLLKPLGHLSTANAILTYYSFVVNKQIHKNLCFMLDNRPFCCYNNLVSENDPLAQSVEHLTFNQGVRGSNPRWVTNKNITPFGVMFLFFVLQKAGIRKGGSVSGRKQLIIVFADAGV